MLKAPPIKSGDFELLPAGTHQAVCIGVYDIGLQKTMDKLENKIMIVFEVNEVMTKGENVGKNFVLSSRYTFSMHEKANLRKMLEQWRGIAFTNEQAQEFDLEKIIGQHCLVNVTHSTGKEGKTYSNIKSVSPLIKGMEQFKPQNAIPFTAEWIDKAIAEGEKNMKKNNEEEPF